MTRSGPGFGSGFTGGTKSLVNLTRLFWPTRSGCRVVEGRSLAMKPVTSCHRFCSRCGAARG